MKPQEVFLVEDLHECRFGAPKKLALGQQKTQPVNEAHEIIIHPSHQEWVKVTFQPVLL